ncbi:MAG: DUF2809 domain-containing protein [Clostridia bacterium]|nr:DUF2809 domain-containing protein [Clostridia bacterium]
MKINLKYLVAFLVLFITEVIIAVFVHDTLIRPYVGDILVVILMYTFIKAFVKKPIGFLPLYLFAFASAVELVQYYNIVNVLHLQDNKVISIIIGSSFDIKDICCYLIATVVLIIWEKIIQSRVRT